MKKFMPIAQKKLRRGAKDAGTEVFQAVGEGIGELDVAGGAGLLHVVAGNGDGVELRHILRGVLEYVGDDAHREFRRVDVGVAHHELLEDVVLDGTCHLFEFGALLKAGVDVEGEYGKHGAVHCHRHGHFVKGDTVEEHLHILYRANAHAGFAYVAHYARMVGIVAAVGGQIEGYREAFLARREVAAVEGVGFGGGREAGILADGPGPDGVHAAIRTTEEGGKAGYVVEVFHPLKIGFCVDGFYGDQLGGEPSLAGSGRSGCLGAECVG